MPTQVFANSICSVQPGATLSQPFGPGHDVWKVAGKIFAVTGADGTAVKTDSVDTAALVIEMGGAVRAPYFHKSWMLVPHGKGPDAELRGRIASSYALIRGGLPKKQQGALG